MSTGSLLRMSKSICVLLGVSYCFGAFSAANSQMESQVIQAPPGTTAAQIEEFNKGAMFINSGKFTDAANVLSGVCKTNPDFAEAHQMLGLAYLKTGRAVEAETELKTADKLKPGMAEVMLNLGSVYQIQGKYPESIAQFKLFLQKFPTSKHATVVKAMINGLQTEQNRTQGIENSAGKDNYFEEALALGPARWQPSQMPIKVVITDGSAAKGFKPEYAKILKDAFTSWADSSEGKLKIEFSNNPDEALILCTWVDDPKDVVNPAEGGQAILAPDEHGRMNQVKVKLLTHNPLFPDGVNVGMMTHVCLHEVGHALGMAGHSSQGDDVMFLTLNPNKPLLALSERDKKTAVLLYSASDADLVKYKRKDDSNNAMMGYEDNPQNKAIMLNAEAIKDLKAGNDAAGFAKLQQAEKLDPGSITTLLNLGNVYLLKGEKSYRAKNFGEAESHLNKAVDYYIKGHRNDVAKTALTNLALIARAQGHEEEAKKIEARASALK